MKPQQIKKKIYFEACQNNRQKCLFCNNTYKENVTRMQFIFLNVQKCQNQSRTSYQKNKVGTHDVV